MKAPALVKARIAVIVTLLAAAALTAGCENSLFRQDHANFQHKVGSSQIAILSVIPWDEYCGSLQPDFQLGADAAFKAAVPTSAHVEEKMIDAFSARFKLATPQTSTTSTETTTASTGQPLSVTQKTERQTKPGDVSQVPSDSPFANWRAKDLPPTSSIIKEDGLEIDPMLKYLVATALYQEVKLLNAYVTNALHRTAAGQPDAEDPKHGL